MWHGPEGFLRAGFGGGVARECNGLILGVMAHCKESVGDNLDAKGGAIWLMMKWAQKEKCNFCIFEA